MQPDPSNPAPRSADRPAGDAPADGPARPGAPAVLARILGYRRLLFLAVVVFAADRVSKIWIQATLPYGAYARKGGIEIIPDFFYLVHVGNTGGAWSIFSGQSTLLGLIGLGVLLAVFLWRRQLALKLPFPQVCFGLFVGGSVGNIVDRLRLGYVTDFLDFHFGSYVYPTFNIADSAICVGVVGYVLWSLWQPPEGGNSKSQTPNAK